MSPNVDDLKGMKNELGGVNVTPQNPGQNPFRNLNSKKEKEKELLQY